MLSLDQTLGHLRERCDLNVVPATTWSDEDVTPYEAATALWIPDELKTVLTRIGHCSVESRDAFVAEYRDGSRSVHEIQILVSSRKTFVTIHDMFITGHPWPDQFTLPMIFFCTADAGHSYLLMDGNNPGNGTVYLWKRATDPFGTGNNARVLGVVAPSLFEFFINLKFTEEILHARSASKMALDLHGVMAGRGCRPWITNGAGDAVGAGPFGDRRQDRSLPRVPTHI